MTNLKPRFGEIWMCRLPHQIGSVQHGTRPVMVVSNNCNNAHSTTLNVIPLTSKIDRRALPMHVFLADPSRYGLRLPSTLLVEQISTIPASSCACRLGEIKDQETLRAVFKAIEIQFPVVGMFAVNGAA